MQKITSTLAFRNFGALTAEAAKGRQFVLTSHGRPVALLGPVPDGLVIEDIEESPIGSTSRTAKAAPDEA